MWPASFLTAALAVLGYGSLLWWITPPADRRRVAFCVLAILPMSWLMFHYVRRPADGWLLATLGKSEQLWWLRAAYAPLTEEPAKLWPLLIPAIRRAITRENAGQYAVALGLGFAVGEIFTVAGLILESSPKVPALPWYQLTGFISERLMTGAIHPAMTALAVVLWTRGRGFGVGLLAAMAAHFLGNFPIGMAQRGWLGGNPAIIQIVLSLWVLACFAIALAWLACIVFTKGKSLSVLLYGRADCPSCGREYERGMFTGLNAGGTRRYERCPHCRKWQWTVAKPKAAA